MNTTEKVLQIDQQEKQLGKLWLLLILGMLSAFGPLSMDMYLPALPTVTDDLNTTASLTQLSITTCLLGLGAGQLVFGPLSDLKGRRKPLLTTLVLYAIASLLCGISPNIWTFIAFRFAQGFTGAAGIVIARAAIRDMYAGKELTRFVALLAVVTGAAPILAPIFGGIILKWTTWHAVFYVLGFIGIAMFFSVLFFLPETLPKHKRVEGNLFSAFKSFGHLLKDRIFIGIAFAQSFISMSMFAYIAASPFVLQNIYGVSPQQFSFIFAMNGLGIIVAAQLAGRLSGKLSEMTLLHTGIFAALSGSIVLLVAVTFQLPLWILMISLFIVVSSVGMVNTTSFSLAMNRQGEIAGSASAFLGILPFAGGALVSPLTGVLGEYNALPMGLVILLCCSLAFLTFTWTAKYQKVEQ